MATPLEKLELEALSLTPQERARLAHILILSLEETEGESPKAMSEAWNAEITTRIEAIESGLAKARPAAQVIAEIKAKYKK